MELSKEPIIVAIELGTSRISGIAGKRKDGNFQILAYAEEQTTACLRRGIVYNIEKTTQSLRTVIDKLSNTLGQQVTRAYVGIGGQSVRSIKKKVHRNLLTQTSITKAHLEELQKESVDIVIPECELLENVNLGYVVDATPVMEPQGIFGTNIEGEYLNIIARTTLRGNIQTCFNTVGVDIVGTRLSALELASNVLTEQEKRAGVAMVDLGAGTTTVVVYKQNTVRFLVTIPIGFQNIIDDIKQVLQIEDKEASEILLKYGNGYIDTEDDTSEITQNSYTTSNRTKVPMSRIHGIIEARLTEIIANAVAQIVNSGLQDTLLAGVVITGGGANMKNIDKAFVNNPRKVKFETLRIARGTVQIPIKHTNASSLNLDNCMSGSLVSLMFAGEENCVGEEYRNDIFTASEADNQMRTNTQRADEDRKKMDEMLERLEAYLDRMRGHINRLNSQQSSIENDGGNKALREEGLRYIETAKTVCGEEFHNLLDSLEMKLKNDQRIATARNLEHQLDDKIEELETVIAKAKKKSSFGVKIKDWLGSLLNEEKNMPP